MTRLYLAFAPTNKAKGIEWAYSWCLANKKKDGKEKIAGIVSRAFKCASHLTVEQALEMYQKCEEYVVKEQAHAHEQEQYCKE